MTRRFSATAQPTTLASDATDSATAIVVTATTGFPATPYTLALDYGTGNQEVVLVTAAAGVNLTVERGYDSTPAVSHSTGAVVRHVHSAIDFREAQTHIDATNGVHGVTGDIVGTTATQSLSNKDMSSGTNTFPSSLATDAEVTSAISTHNGQTVAHGATGAVVGTTNTQTLTNKDLSSGTNTFPATLATDAELTTHANLTAAHGATGAVMGTTNTQTVTNKDLSSGTNTFPTSLVTLAGSQSLSNKTLASPVINNATGVGQSTTVYKTTDQGKTSTTTLGNDTELVVTGLPEGLFTFELTAFVKSNADAAGDIKIGFSGPGVISQMGGHGLTPSLASGSVGSMEAKAIDFPGTSTISYGVSSSLSLIKMHGLFSTLSGDGGGSSLQTRWAQLTSDAATTYVSAYSYLTVTRIA